MLAGYEHDEPLLTAARIDGTAHVDVYRYPGIAVVIGQGGQASRELHLSAIREDRIPVLRRRGGGCAVVLDPGNLIISLALPLPGVGGISTAFDQISEWLIERLAECGVGNVVQRGVSDLVLGDRKIGGSCIWRTRDLLYYSSTLLVDPLPGVMDRYLHHPPREPEYRGARNHDAFTTSLVREDLATDPDVLRVRLLEAVRTNLHLLTGFQRDVALGRA